MKGMRAKKYLFTVGLTICMAAGTLLGGRRLSVHAEQKTLPQEDLNKGVTYELNDAGSIQFVNLHGNSVVIQDVPAEEGGSVQFHNFYIDANHNGKIDEGEKKVDFGKVTGLDVEDTHNVPCGIPVYGLYQASSTEPIYITAEGTNYSRIFGAYNSEASSVSMNIAATANEVYGAYNSTLSKVSIQIVDGSQSNVCGSSGGTVGSVDIQINKDTSDMTNYIYGVQNGSVKTTDDISAAVAVTLTNGNTGSIYAAQGTDIQAGADVKTAVSVKVAGGFAGAVYGVQGGSVTMENRDDTAIDIEVVEKGSVKGGLYGIANGYNNDVNMKVKGAVRINVGQEKDCVDIHEITRLETVGSCVELDGELAVNIDNVVVESGMRLGYYTIFYQNVSLNIGKNTEVKGIVGLENCVAERDVTLNVYGTEKENSAIMLTGATGSFSAAGYNYTIGGNLTAISNGGNWGQILGINSGRVLGDINLLIKEGTITNTFDGVQNSTVDGNATIQIGKYALSQNETTDKEVQINGMIQGFGGNIGGDAVFQVENNAAANGIQLFMAPTQVKGNLIYNVDGGNYGSVNSSYCEGSVEGDCVASFDNVSSKSDLVILRCVNVGGNCDVTANKVTVGDYGQFTAISNYTETTYKKDVHVVITNCKVDNTVYYCNAIRGGIIKGDVTVETAGNTSNYFNVLGNSVNITGNVNISSSNEKVKDIESGNGEFSLVNTSNQTYSGVSIGGNLTATIVDSEMIRFYGIYASSVIGESDIQIKGGSCKTYLSPVNITKSELDCGDVTFVADGTTFGSSEASMNIENNISSKINVDENILSSCNFLGEYKVSNNTGYYYGKASLRLLIDEELYLAGTYKLLEDVTVDNIYLSSSSYIHVPQGKTMAAKENGKIHAENGARVLVEGDVNGTISTETGEQYGEFYMYGGNITPQQQLERVYYPMTFQYLEKGGTISDNTYELLSCPDVKFARSNSDVNIIPTAKKGYQLAGVYSKKQSEDKYTDLEESASQSNRYVYSMTEEPVDIKIDFIGKQITLGKTIPDPVAKIGEESTLQKPLYDMENVIISNDGEEGEVTYELDQTQTLPEGLQFKDGKIYGTPSELYPEGKNVVIHVTGCNGTTADFVLLIKVTETGEETGNEDGRIQVDETNHIIHLQGNSVVIDEVNGNTAIFVDDNQDGIADGNVPIYTGDLSQYTIYGIRDASMRKPIRITMNGGTIAGIYGAKDATLTVDQKDAVVVSLTGGTVSGNVVLADGTTVKGTMAAITQDTANYKNVYSTQNQAKCTGSCLNLKGDITIMGNYSLKEDVVAANLAVDSEAECIITEGTKVSLSGTLTAYFNSKLHNNGTIQTAKTSIRSTAYIYNKGDYTCTDSFTNAGTFLAVKGKLIPEDNEWNYVYYPVKVSTDLKGATVTKGDGFAYYAVDGTSQMFGRGGTACTMMCTSVPGYIPYASVNNGEEKEIVANSYTFIMPRQRTEIEVMYQPTTIEVQKTFSDPVGEIGKEYTVEQPLYDLNELTVNNDTTKSYGTDRIYEVQKGSSLPDGMILSDGKLIGTLSEKAKDSDTTFSITGRNGTTTSITVHITVSEKVTQRDINDLVKVTSDQIDLQGTSVVIRQSAAGSTYSSIYLDDDRDGVADNMNGLVINGTTDLWLSNYYICGCTKDSAANVKEDISITMYGGTVGYLYGAFSKEKSFTVDANIAVNVKGGNVKYGAAAGYYAGAKNLSFDAEAGTFCGKIYGAYMPQNVENVYFGFHNTAVLEYQNRRKGCMYVTEGGTVGDIQVEIGTKQNYGFAGSVTYFYGVSGTAVTNDVNYVVDGWWEPASFNIFGFEANIGGDMNMEWKSGTIEFDATNEMNIALLRDGSVRNMNVNVPQGAEVNGLINLALGTKAKNITFNAPKTTGNVTVNLYNNNNLAQIEDGAYVNYNGDLQIDGSYTVTEDLSVGKITTYSKTQLLIPEDVTLINTDKGSIQGTVVNQGAWKSTYQTTVNGTIDNQGTIEFVGTTSSAFAIESTGKLVNREGASCDIGCPLSNSGKIVNYGTLTQGYTGSSSASVGNIYTTTVPKLAKALTNYNSIYYAISLECPDDYAKGVQLTDDSGKSLSNSGIDGDTKQYLLGGKAFRITIDDTESEKVVSTITYNQGTTENVNMTKENDQNVWSGQIGHAPSVITFNFKDVIPITLEPASASVENVKVGVATTQKTPLYDLTTVSIQGDNEESSGNVSYTLDPSTSLPSGLYLSNGKIYGTPKEACATETKVKILIKGRNQTTATFTLVIPSIAKGEPKLLSVTGLSAHIGDVLQTIALPDYSLKVAKSAGVYAWLNPDAVVEASEDGEQTYDAVFTPKDTDNYDWSVLEENGKIIVPISVTIQKKTPGYTVPDSISATYGDTFKEIDLPKDPNGKFVWNADVDLNASVGNVGRYECYLDYIPNDTVTYATVKNIKTVLRVYKKKVTSFVPDCTEFKTIEGNTLGDIELPVTEQGKYIWHTIKTTVPKDGESYEVLFQPKDVKNYDWSGIEGYDESNNGVIIRVTVKVHTHNYSGAWEKDSVSHWKKCSCGAVGKKEMHIWNAGNVTKEPTATEQGQKTYQCNVCGQVKTELIPATGQTPAKPDESVKPDVTQTEVVPAKGTVLTNTKKKEKYKVVSAKGEKPAVEYSGTTNKKATSINIPATVTIDNVKYDVVAIGSGAFKNNGKIKKIVIPASVSKIGSKAFYGCKKLTSITIKTTKLTTKTVGSSAFTKAGSKNYKKLTVKVPKKQLKAYKKMLVKRGLNKKSKIKS